MEQALLEGRSSDASREFRTHFWHKRASSCQRTVLERLVRTRPSQRNLFKRILKTNRACRKTRTNDCIAERRSRSCETVFFEENATINFNKNINNIFLVREWQQLSAQAPLCQKVLQTTDSAPSVMSILMIRCTP